MPDLKKENNTLTLKVFKTQLKDTKLFLNTFTDFLSSKKIQKELFDTKGITNLDKKLKSFTKSKNNNSSDLINNIQNLGIINTAKDNTFIPIEQVPNILTSSAKEKLLEILDIKSLNKQGKAIFEIWDNLPDITKSDEYNKKYDSKLKNLTPEEKIENILRDEKIIEGNQKFNWEDHSAFVAEHCSDLLNPNKYNWKENGDAILRYCPQHFDPDKYNFEDYSGLIVYFYPKGIEEEKFNWEKASASVLEFWPEKLDIKKANLNNILETYSQYKNMTIEEIKEKAIELKIENILKNEALIENEDSFSWEEHSYIIPQVLPELNNLDKYNWKEDSWAIIEYCPEKLDLKKANLENIIQNNPEYKNMSLKEIKEKAIEEKIINILKKEFNKDLEFHKAQDAFERDSEIEKHLSITDFSWEEHSYLIAQVCPELIIPEKYNWEKNSGFIVLYCQDNFDPNRFNWGKASNFLVREAPEKLDLIPNDPDIQKAAYEDIIKCHPEYKDMSLKEIKEQATLNNL